MGVTISTFKSLMKVLAPILLYYGLGWIFMTWGFGERASAGAGYLVGGLLIFVSAAFFIAWLTVPDEDEYLGIHAKTRKTFSCPYCGSRIPVDAKICPYCHTELPKEPTK